MMIDTPKVRRLVQTLAEGSHYHYPACCVLRFAWEEWRRGDAPQAMERGIRRLPKYQRALDDSCGTYVRCGWLHR